jgi:hypothetical protein
LFMVDFSYRDVDPGMGKAVASRTVFRTTDGVEENWGDVAQRVALGNWLLDKEGQPEEFERLRDHIAMARILMSGRHLQHGDASQPSTELELYSNCSTSAASFIKFLLLLCGSGVGRSYDDELMVVDWTHLPEFHLVLDADHPDYNELGNTKIPYYSRERAEKMFNRVVEGEYDTSGRDLFWFEVPDTREGWAQILEELEVRAFQEDPTIVVLDFSGVRERGAPIGGMQGRPASGPVPLMEALHNIREMSEKAKAESWPKWKQAMYVDHYTADCVAVGGSRRAARIAIKNYNDPGIFEFINIKNKGGLWSANNSIGVDAAFWKNAAIEGTRENKVFIAACKAAYHNGSGEPGFVNLDKIQGQEDGLADYVDGAFFGDHKYQVLGKTKDEFLPKVVDRFLGMRYKFIQNPCLSSYMQVLTPEGLKRIYAVEVGDKIWSSEGWTTVLHKHDAGRKVVHEYVTEEGMLSCTAEHKVVLDGEKVLIAQAKELEFLHSKGLTPPKKVEITKVKKAGKFSTYDLTVDNASHSFWCNGFNVSNCGEIRLSALGGYCVLSDIVPFFADDLEQALDAFRAGTRALIRTNLMPALYQREVHRTNRIGVGITGMHEFAWKHFGMGFRELIADFDELIDLDIESGETSDAASWPFWNFLRQARLVVEEEADAYSEQLGLNKPHTYTTVKPAGSTSKLFGLSEGVHLPAMQEYLRWVQFDKADPLVDKYASLGYPVRREVPNYTRVSLVGFPTQPTICRLDIPREKLVTAPEATLEEQFQWLKLLEKFWLGPNGNQISFTMKYYKKDVGFDAYCESLLKNMPEIRCVSLMETSDWQVTEELYGYSPETPMVKEEYDELVSHIKAIEEVITEDDLYCEGGACPI